MPRSITTAVATSILLGLLSAAPSTTFAVDPPIVDGGPGGQQAVDPDRAPGPRGLPELDPAELATLRAREPARATAATVALHDRLGLTDADDFEIIRTTTDRFGVTHTRLQLHHGGVPVLGGEVIAHTAADDAVLEPSGRLDGSPAAHGPITTPTLTADDALAIALGAIAPAAPARTPQISLAFLPARVDEVRPEADTQLNASDLVARTTGYQLVYRVQLAVRSQQHGVHEWMFLIDAQTGAIAQQLDILPTFFTVGPGPGDGPVANEPSAPVPPNGHSQYSGDVYLPVTVDGPDYMLQDSGRGAGNAFLDHTGGNAVFDQEGEDPDVLFTRPLLCGVNDWGDGLNHTGDELATMLVDDCVSARQTAAVDAYYGATVTWDFFAKVFGRVGLDGAGMSLTAYVHAEPPTPMIAYWDPSYGSAFFSDPIAPGNQPVEIDIVGHEFAHGFFQLAVGFAIDDSSEFGGINEANSDIFGTLIEFYESAYLAGAGDAVPETGGDFDMGAQWRNPPRRYLHKPSKNGSGYDEWFEGIDDPEHKFHDVGGVVGRMFYFLSQGARPELQDPERSTPHLPDGFAGIGNDLAARIWYRALTSYLAPGARFVALREACLSAAADLHGEHSGAYVAVENAFAAVNIGPAPDEIPPVIGAIQFSRPAHDTIYVTAEVSDDREVESVRFLVDGEQMGAADTAPVYATAFPESWIDSGQHVLLVEATDTGGNVAVKSLDFSSDVSPPYVWGVATDNSTAFRPRWTVDARDDFGVQRVELYFDGELVDIDDSAPYTFFHGTTGYDTGDYWVRAVVYDWYGNVGDHSWMYHVENELPVIHRLGVTESSGIATLYADITGFWPDQSRSVYFFVDGEEVGKIQLPAGSSMPGDRYKVPFDTRTVANGTHRLGVHAHDFHARAAYRDTTFAVSNTSGPSPGGVTVTETEPNDWCANADFLPANTTTVVGGISSASDLSDHFRVTVPAGQLLTVSMSYPGSDYCYDLRGLIFFPDGTTGPADEASDWQNPVIYLSEPGGAREFCIAVALPNYDCPGYTLTLSTTVAGPPSGDGGSVPPSPPGDVAPVLPEPTETPTPVTVTPTATPTADGDAGAQSPTCTREVTVASIRCRLARLQAVADALSAPRRIRRGIVKQVRKANDSFERAMLEEGRRRASKLRRADRALGRIPRRFRSRSVRRALSEEIRSALAAAANALREDIAAL